MFWWQWGWLKVGEMEEIRPSKNGSAMDLIAWNIFGWKHSSTLRYSTVKFALLIENTEFKDNRVDYKNEKKKPNKAKQLDEQSPDKREAKGDWSSKIVVNIPNPWLITELCMWQGNFGASEISNGKRESSNCNLRALNGDLCCIPLQGKQEFEVKVQTS